MGETPNLTERQQKWFASVRASLQRETGKTIEEWVAIARTCPETKPRARSAWLKAHHGLGANRATYVLGEAFPSAEGWHNPDLLRSRLWTDPQSTAILDALNAAALRLPETTASQRKQFTAFSRKVQFAALRPVKGGHAMLGLALDPDADPRLQPAAKQAWSERLKAQLLLTSAAQVDASIEALLRSGWERS